MISSSQLRESFLAYFRARGHEVVPSSPLIPVNDPTLLFTNAGMVQFKDVFLARETRPYTRATSVQRCVRAGGKHNDLENVGFTARHHTFFEMLGNFSFGDYFKREAIHMAWEYLVSVLELPPQRLWVTVFEEDDEAAGIWLNEIKVAPERFVRVGAKDNFWAMGDTGPCGPCSEIFYDHGPGIVGEPPGSADPFAGLQALAGPQAQAYGDRYVEIWNLVFMQYDRHADGTLKPLPKPSVDTGMGLERLAAVMQGVHDNYEIDSFRTLISAVEAAAGGNTEHHQVSLRIIADHIRSCAFLIVDGVLPSNEGRGYVLRRIIRRAVRQGTKLGLHAPFFHKLVGSLAEEMGDAYPELTRAREHVERVLRQEEERFRETLEQGLKVLEQAIAGLKTDQPGGAVLSGETIFRLYDTFGFPVDLTGDIARERGLALDREGFEREMHAQRERARAASQFTADYETGVEVRNSTDPSTTLGTCFTGYTHLVDEGRITALIREGKRVDKLKAGEAGSVVLDRTPFYAEAGGQVGDRGVLRTDDAEFEVNDTQKLGAGAHAHIGQLRKACSLQARSPQGMLRVGERVQTRVDTVARQATVLNHSATHLLHAALRHVLGEHVTQKGSRVAPDRLRFDFSHYEPLRREEIEAIERLVNAQIRENHAAEVCIMPYEEAIESGAMALFGEKYSDQVRVMRFGNFSTELCGGTHVDRVGDIGFFKIISETGIASGVRRIEALTGERAVAWVEALDARLARIAALLKGGSHDVDDKVRQLIERNRTVEKEVERLKGKLASQIGADLAAKAQDVNGLKVLAARLDGADPKSLREAVDQLKHKLGSAAIVLAAVVNGNVNLVAGVTADRTGQIHAGRLVNAVAQQLGGRGGGRPDMAQAGGNNPAALDAALASVPDWIRQHLG
jgi:alanine--tRNA ligase